MSTVPSWLCGDPVPAQCITTVVCGFVPAIAVVLCLICSHRSSTQKRSALILTLCILALGTNIGASLALDPWITEPEMAPKLVLTNYTIASGALHVGWATGAALLSRNPACVAVTAGVAFMDRISILVSMRDSYWHDDASPPASFLAMEALVLLVELCLACSGAWKACTRRHHGDLNERLLHSGGDMEAGSSRDDVHHLLRRGGNKDEDLFPDETTLVGWATAYLKMHGDNAECVYECAFMSL
jgi:hypothetical protein